MPIRYHVEHRTICQGWINCWTSYDQYGNPSPTLFDTREQAKEELSEYLAESMYYFQTGTLESPESRDNYRISAVEVAEQQTLF